MKQLRDGSALPRDLEVGNSRTIVNRTGWNFEYFELRVSGLHHPVARPWTFGRILRFVERGLACFRREHGAAVFLLPWIGRCIDISEVQPAGARQKNPRGVAGNFSKARVVAVDRS